ncbi:MAG TPA: ABC transporter substrate-binding protein [Xanthobacteraceae bacterium]
MQFDPLKRRELVALLGGAAAWPLAAQAQQPDRMRRIAVLLNYASDDPEAQARLGALLQGLQQHGWSIGRNVRIEYRFGALDPNRLRKFAAELVAWDPDVIVANAPPSVVALQEVSRSVPIVFAAVTDPVGLGIVQSLARPGGNATGFTPAEFSTSAKWLELLKELAPNVRRVAILRDLSNPSAVAQFAAIQTAAAALGLEVSAGAVRTVNDIEHDLAEFAKSPNGGVIVTRLTETISKRQTIIESVARHQLPAVYPLRLFAAAGGLAAYGPDIVDEFRRAAGYVDRILRGEKPADLPVQAPTRYELVLNLKTAKALGLDVPPILLARADEVIE